MRLVDSALKGNLSLLAGECRSYLERGIVQYDKLLSLSMHARIPNLTHIYGLDNIHRVMIVLLTSFNNSLNLIRPMSSDQIVECAYELVMTTEEDQLSMEDYVLFFKGAREGKYGKILDRLDHQTIFTMLEEYREARHREFLKIKQSRHLEQKGAGPSDRMEPNQMEQQFYNMAGRLNDLKEKLQAQREINRASRL